MAKQLIKSADEDQFELDEQAVNEISNAEEFADVKISNEDVIEAVKVIDALADSVLEKADSENKEIDADTLLDKVRDMIDDSHEETEEVEIEEEAVIPEEIESAAVRIMVSEDGAIDLEQKPDEIYNSSVDGMDCTVFDTCEDYDVGELDETADVENTEDDVLIIGNSAAKDFRKGYAKIKASSNKKAWNSAFKKVKEMVGSSKLTPAHWVIVSAIAKKEEEEDKKAKKVECALLRYIRSNKEIKEMFMNVLKSNAEEIDPRGQTEKEAKPETTVGEGNPGYEEVKGKTATGEVTSDSGNPTEDPDKQTKREGEIVLPEEEIIVVTASLANTNRNIRLQRVRSSRKGYNLYKVVSGKDNGFLDGRVIKSGNIAYAFRQTSQGMLACCAEYVEEGKGGIYKPVIKNNKIVISKGELAPVFQNYETICLAKSIVSSRKQGFEAGMKKAQIESSKRVVKSECEEKEELYFGDYNDDIHGVNVYTKQEYIDKFGEEPDEKSRLENGVRRRPVKSNAEEELYYSYGDNGLEMVTKEEYKKIYGKDPDEGSRVTNAARRRPVRVNNSRRPVPAHKPVNSSKMTDERRKAIRASIEARRAQRNEQKAIESKLQLQKMHENEERQRLFQSSQTQMNEERVAIKSKNTRNIESLNKLYNSMF